MEGTKIKLLANHSPLLVLLMLLVLLLLARWRQLAALHFAADCSVAADPAGSPLASQEGALSSAPGRCPAWQTALLAWAAARDEHASPVCLAALQGTALTHIPHHLSVSHSWIF